MPLSYPSGTIDEHLACRNDAVVFDVSHLGTVRVEGADAAERLQLAFTNDGRFLMGGGQVLSNYVLPAPNDSVGVPVRLSGAAQSLVYVPGVDIFAASAGGDGGGVIGGRTPDGLPLAAPFPIGLGSAGGLLAASDYGDLFIAWQTSGGYEVRVLRPGVERATKGVLRVPGTGTAFAIDPSGKYGAAVTDQGTYRFQVNAADPTREYTIYVYGLASLGTVTIGAVVLDQATRRFGR